MANRRQGGPNQRGNRTFSAPFQGGGGGVSPWQGPQNSMNQGGLLSQITSAPQQLALALTSLLQPQQQMNNPPSLLSLNTSSGFSNQDRDFNRFGNRGNRRVEPYNKNRNGWRPQDGGRRPNQKNQPNKDKKADVKVKTENEESTEDGDKKKAWKDEKTGEEKGDDAGNKEGTYTGVPVKFLNCFVCNKAMWDGESMQKHVRGRAHREMLDRLEESIHITVNILRENMRLAEEKKVIEFHRMQRVQKKFHKIMDESHCNMCDLKFLGKIVVHRKSDGHQRLKKYLHPNCAVCDKEFPSRMEWVEHRLTPEHLRKLKEHLGEKAGDADGDIITEEELDLEPLLEEQMQLEVDNPIMELTDDLSGLQNLMPAYKPDRAVSTQSLKEFNGFRCELCHRSFHSEEVAQAHLKTKNHYYNFIEAAKEKHTKQLEEERKKKEALKKEAEGEKNEPQVKDENMYDPEEACSQSENDGKENQA